MLGFLMVGSIAVAKDIHGTDHSKNGHPSTEHSNVWISMPIKIPFVYFDQRSSTELERWLKYIANAAKCQNFFMLVFKYQCCMLVQWGARNPNSEYRTPTHLLNILKFSNGIGVWFSNGGTFENRSVKLAVLA